MSTSMLLQDVRLGNSLGAPIEKPGVYEGCIKPSRCDDRCIVGASTCQAGWQSNTCQCNEGM